MYRYKRKTAIYFVIPGAQVSQVRGHFSRRKSLCSHIFDHWTQRSMNIILSAQTDRKKLSDHNGFFYEFSIVFKIL